MFQVSYGIFFDKPYNTYFSGETVSGRIEVIFDKPTDIKGIELRIKGEAQVLWHETVVTNSGGQRRQHTVEHQAREEYLKTHFYCFGGNDRDKITMAPGKYVYPFSFILPVNLPSSFEGKFGSIRYTAKMTVERPWKWNKEIKAAFTVITPYNLNIVPNVADPCKITNEKYFCCLCCKSGPLSCNIMLPKSGYVSGETMQIIIEVDNASNVKVGNVNLRFIQHIEYYSTQPTKGVMKEVIEIEKFKLGPVNPHDSKSWSQQLLIPPLPPSNLSMCSIIISQYRLVLKVSATSGHKDLKSILPITIGTIPILNAPPNAEMFAQPPPPDYETTMSNEPGNSNFGWAGNPSAPVATFSGNKLYQPKSIQDSEDNEHTVFDENSKAYTPYYPTYNFN